ncbi:hypothetical protein EX895_000430 [Sporisorium graminicola]|uniref:Uncharacterized protein n=1 Tax=Sporisorium graminicola TaxID=280036 RepID=A0A4U7L4R4_9BASI|nr:hypothetical protein EX895_000430 [Sporisorium graminicola]TKY90432.1 hypothetical protein EX895_000430 [Sporisorium graminicola]
MSSQLRHNAHATQTVRSRRSPQTTWLSVFGFKPQVTWRNATAFLVHCSASILFLVFLNASQPFLIHQLESRRPNGYDVQPPSRAGSLSGSLIFYDELLSTFMSLIWGALAELVGLAAVTSTSYLFVALGLVTYTLPTKPWPNLVPARLVFAIGGSGATAMLSGILSVYSGSHSAQSPLVRADALTQQSTDQDTEPAMASNSQGAEGEQERHLLESRRSENGHSIKQRNRHGRVAAIAGVFTGLGALVAVFVLVRLPATIAEYLEQHSPANPSHDLDGGARGDVAIRRATVATFWLVAALALLVASITALGLKQPKSRRRRLEAAGVLTQSSRRHQQDYGALHDSTIALAEDSRQARRARLRQRQERRSQASLTNAIRSHVRRFVVASIGGFRLVGPVGKLADSPDGDETLRSRKQLAQELRMAYLGGALARAFTIGTTAFLPLLVTHHYYTSGLCRQLPSPDPNSPLPNDELKKLCRSAFTATAILGGTAQLTALLASPLIGLLCDTLSPTITISMTSALGAVGFYLLGVGASGFAGDRTTGEEVPDPLTRLSIGAAVLIGLGQIGAIVASLAGCARARSLVTEEQLEHTSAVSSSQGDHETADTASASDTSRGVARRSHSEVAEQEGQGAGAIAGAYTCTGSLSILLISKLGGSLFDMYVPSPFLLIGGFSLFVSLFGFGTSIAKRFERT